MALRKKDNIVATLKRPMNLAIENNDRRGGRNSKNGTEVRDAFSERQRFEQVF